MPRAGPFCPVNSLPVSVNPSRGLNCFWEMPFRKHCRITLENSHPTDAAGLLLPDQLHADRRAGRLPPTSTPSSGASTRCPTARSTRSSTASRGRAITSGTSMGWGINNNGWWGEGEIKFYIDGDGEFPTICGTGTEDYFGGGLQLGRGRPVRRPTPRRSWACTRSCGPTARTSASTATRCTAGT